MILLFALQKTFQKKRVIAIDDHPLAAPRVFSRNQMQKKENSPKKRVFFKAAKRKRGKIEIPIIPIVFNESNHSLFVSNQKQLSLGHKNIDLQIKDKR